jgi:hypothetical protein
MRTHLHPSALICTHLHLYLTPYPPLVQIQTRGRSNSDFNTRAKTFPVSNKELRILLARAKEIFLRQPCLLRLEAPVNVVGDLHGHFSDLLRYFHEGGRPPTTNYLFLGDYVDRGAQGLETVCLLLALKCKYPDQIHMLRGNHECIEVRAACSMMREPRVHRGTCSMLNDAHGLVMQCSADAVCKSGF